MSRETAQAGSGGRTAGFVVALIVIIIALGKCSSEPSAPTISKEAPFGVASLANQAAAVNRSEEIATLSRRAARRGMTQVRLAIAAEGLSGAMIYSQNCYDRLTRDFTWDRLDACAGADLLAVRSVRDGDEATHATESAFFASEAAAGRFLKLAERGGASPEAADTRLEALIALASTGAPPVIAASAAVGTDSDW